MRVVDKIWIVIRLIPAEVDFLEQPALHEQAKGAVEGGAGGGGINFPGAFPEFFRREMVCGIEGGFNNNFALPGMAQALGGSTSATRQ